MEWNGTEITDVQGLITAICAVKSREEAERFIAAYEAENVHARENIGYIAGYCDADTSRRIWDWFGCAHPIFGTRIPTAEEAFEAGKQWARGMI